MPEAASSSTLWFMANLDEAGDLRPGDVDGDDAGHDEPRSRKGLVIALSIIVISSVAIGVAAWQSSSSRAEWSPELIPLAQFIEAERGLEFQRPVRMNTFDPAFLESELEAIEEELARMEEELAEAEAAGEEIDEEDFDGLGSFEGVNTALELLGLSIDGSFDPSLIPDEQRDFNAWFDPLNGEISVPDNRSFVELAPVIVHELVHALHLQNGLSFTAVFEFDPDTPVDAFDLWASLSEGDAVRIEHAYLDQLADEERSAYEAATGLEFTGYRDPTFGHPWYTVGEPLVNSIVARGGQEALDELMRTVASSASTSTALWIDPFDSGQLVVAADLIELPDGADEADGDVGAFGWFRVLAPLIGTPDAFDVVEGYAGDAFAAFDDNECARYAVFFDSGNDATEFDTAMSGLGAETDQDDSNNSVTFDLCEALRDSELASNSVAMPVIVAQQLITHHLENGVAEEAAACAAIAQAKTVPFDFSLENFDGYDTFFDESAPFLSGC